ncbi:MAG TPA: nucleoside phosphorylase [Bacteroidales bacterium]|nr:nucleoside phosphorylase [Bacteroidales bacterium]HQP03972.1 nucleoside phosphorylase [Bacteroidales bacterium]
MKKIADSELILNTDGTIFHLHLLPHQIADDILLVGDQGRVDMISKHFEKLETRVQNREFVTQTGVYNGKRITVISTGIGTDNIDIVVNELDALVNIDMQSRTEKPEKKSLNFIRIGTSGGMQPYLNAGDFLVSDTAIGFDGLLNFYHDSQRVCRSDYEESLISYLNYHTALPRPYVVDADKTMIDMLGEGLHHGVTISAPGFYGPQGRELRLGLVDPDINSKISAYRFGKEKITNYEMESSAIFGLSKMLGHKAVTVCVIIASRFNKTALPDYKPKVEELVQLVLDRITGR